MRHLHSGSPAGSGRGRTRRGVNNCCRVCRRMGSAYGLANSCVCPQSEDDPWLQQFGPPALSHVYTLSPHFDCFSCPPPQRADAAELYKNAVTADPRGELFIQISAGALSAVTARSTFRFASLCEGHESHNCISRATMTTYGVATMKNSLIPQDFGRTTRAHPLP